MVPMDEYVGGYYYLAPYPLNGALRRILGYSRSDTYRVRRRKLQLALLTLPALGIVLFYALVSFFTPRYSLPAVPLALCAAAALSVTLFGRFRRSKETLS
jgi:hypothetical protein